MNTFTTRVYLSLDSMWTVVQNFFQGIWIAFYEGYLNIGYEVLNHCKKWTLKLQFRNCKFIFVECSNRSLAIFCRRSNHMALLRANVLVVTFIVHEYSGCFLLVAFELFEIDWHSSGCFQVLWDYFLTWMPSSAEDP